MCVIKHSRSRGRRGDSDEELDDLPKKTESSSLENLIGDADKDVEDVLAGSGHIELLLLDQETSDAVLADKLLSSILD